MIRSFLLGAAVALLLPQAAFASARRGPSEVQGSALRAEDQRVAQVAYRIGRASARFCSETYPLTGLLLHHLAEYDAEGRKAMMEA